MGEVNVEGLTAAYRRLVLWFGVQLVLTPVAVGIRLAFGESAIAAALGLAHWAAMLITIGALAYYGHRTAAALTSRVAWLWAVAMLVPCLNVLTLLILSSWATHACQSHGIPVGLLGPKTARGSSQAGGADGAA
jgi:hypothetical protein